MLKLCVTILAACSVALSAVATTDPDPAAAVDAFMRDEMAKRRIPGLQLAIVRGGKIALLRAYGSADLQNNLPVNDQTVFMLNSITKAFTGVAILQLLEEGKLELDAPIGRYLEELPTTWRQITVRQLLTHQSGLPQIMDGDAKMISDRGEAASWKKVRELPLEARPGAQFSYNQTNYLLLGKIIDKRAKQPFASFIQQRQLDRVGMSHTTFGDSRDLIPAAARVYTFFHKVDGETSRSEQLFHQFEEFPPSLRTAAGLNSTAEDLAHWIIALQHGDLLARPPSLGQLWEPGVTNKGVSAGFTDFLNGYALGWPRVLRERHPAAAAVGGGRSALMIYVEDDLSIVVLTNLVGAAPETLIDRIAALYDSRFRTVE